MRCASVKFSRPQAQVQCALSHMRLGLRSVSLTDSPNIIGALVPADNDLTSDEKIAEQLTCLLPATIHTGTNAAAAIVPWFCDRLPSNHCRQAYLKDLSAFAAPMRSHHIRPLSRGGTDNLLSVLRSNKRAWNQSAHLLSLRDPDKRVVRATQRTVNLSNGAALVRNAPAVGQEGSTVPPGRAAAYALGRAASAPGGPHLRCGLRALPRQHLLVNRPNPRGGVLVPEHLGESQTTPLP